MDLHRHGHPRDREGLSLSEYMHGHGVNLRHIGLLRSLLLQEIAAASIKGMKDPIAANHMEDGDKVINGSYSKIAPSVSNITQSSIATSVPSTDIESAHISLIRKQSVNVDSMDSIDCDPEVGGVGGGPSKVPGVFTPALDALQSELLLEALCRTLKVNAIHIFLLFYCL